MSTETEGHSSDTINLPNPEDEIKLNAEPLGPSAEGGLNQSILAWASVIQVLADAEPVTAAGIGGVLVIIVLSVFGRIGSLIVGVLAGLLLHASIEKRRDSAPAYRELPKFPPEPESILDREEPLPHIIPPKTNLALRYFWDLLIRDYVDWWFGSLSPDTEFPSACRRSLEIVASSFASHVQSKVPSEMVMLAIMSASSTLIVFFRELRSASMETESATGVAEYIRNNPDSALAQMVDEKFQHEKLRYLSTRLLSTFAKKKDLECDAGRLFAREMLAMQVFNLTASSCSMPSYINWYIVETFKDVQDQGGLLGKDGRAKEAEEAMSRAVAEAAEMTRLLELEKEARELRNDDVTTSITALQPAEPVPKTTFASLLRDPDILPHPPHRVDSVFRQSGGLPPTPDRIDAVEAKLRNSPSEDSFSPTANPPVDDSSPRLSSTSLQYDEQPQETLQGAKITLIDLSTDAGTGKPVRQRSTLSYMITIEPPGGRVPGWVAIKQFTEFESLHDVLRRIANVGGIRSFPTELPEWKGKMHQPLADNLENYLKTALSVKQLADSEAMKRFFGKEITDQSLGKKKAWPPLKGVGEGVRDAMVSSAEGSQKLLAAAWATAGINKKRSSAPIGLEKPKPEITVKDVKNEVPTTEEDTAYHSPSFRNSTSVSGLGTTNSFGGDNGLERSSTSSSLNGYTFIGEGEGERSDSASTTSFNTPNRLESRTPVESTEPDSSIALGIPAGDPMIESQSTSAPVTKSPSPAPQPLPERPTKPTVSKQSAPELSPNDAQQILDIGFSILSELYALSPRTWMIRKSLLNLLKSLLISNGRTYIETIRTMIQEDLINKCLTSDEWLASQVKAITESMWPTAPWPPMDEEANRIHAKELFMTKMLPETMRGLMGGAATTQALEIVFEALQDQRVAKGILVALMCDVIRALQV